MVEIVEMETLEALAQGYGLNMTVTMTYDRAGWWDWAEVAMWDPSTGNTVWQGKVGGGGSFVGILEAAQEELMKKLPGSPVFVTTVKPGEAGASTAVLYPIRRMEKP